MEGCSLLPKGILKNCRDYGGDMDLRKRRSSIWLPGCEDLYIRQAVVLIEDAMNYRSINHHMDSRSLQLYRWYYSRTCQWFLNAVIAIILGLAFIERPSSLSETSDLRYKQGSWEAPCGMTEGIEMLCILIFALDLAVKVHLIGGEEFWKCKWLMGYMVVITISLIDWMVSLRICCDEYNVRIRRLFRPFFLLQNSSLMKKSLKCIKRTLPEMMSVILIITIHLCIFTVFGMLLFASGEESEESKERELYFSNVPQSLLSLVVLLTTANNPDVMTPAYSANRGYSIFFILFSGFGTFFLFNLLTAVIYNRFRGYLLLSIQTSILRRKMGIRAAFELLSCQAPALRLSDDDITECVPVKTFVRVLKLVEMDSYYRQAIMKKALRLYSGHIEREAFQKLFNEPDVDRIKEHPPPPVYSSAILQRLQRVLGGLLFIVMGKALALANVICICTILIIDSHKTFSQLDDYYLESINCFFIVCYTLEMLLKVIILGWRGYLSYGSNVFDGLLTVLLLGLQISILAIYRLPFPNWSPAMKGLLPLREMARLVNMLIVFRFLRVIFSIKLTALVASTVVDLVKNLRAFAGILVVVFYIFAVIGMWLFKGVIVAPANNSSSMKRSNASLLVQCGTYEQLGYWPNNFDDFASALVLLYNVMVVNNWQVFLDVYSRHTSEWSKIYFIVWWLISSVMWVNLFVALILENFIYKWDRNHGSLVLDVDSMDLEATVELMFRERIPEPTEEEVVDRLHNNPHLHLNLSQNGQHFS
ncbi:two pore calcium channel protein 2-like [Denticeps clupeoides]|uniref:two pore calcium channel protein 2-like n=1 Tax=Denticeps clupeoides TaxID=299321 RepID=UPI0010A4C4E6|nr:two pore calcium channel protein 2-like [Denticeps clupeoides]